MIRLEKIGRTGGLFGLIFSRANYVTTEPVDLDGLIVPPGFPTDIVSGPWWGRWLLPNDHMRDAAIRHDMRRRLQPKRDTDDIDKVFRDEMRTAGVTRFWCWLCWRAVKTNNNR